MALEAASALLGTRDVAGHSSTISSYQWFIMPELLPCVDLYSCWIDRQRLAKLEAALAHKDSEIAALRATLASRACSHWTWPGAHLPTHGADTLARSRNDEQTGAQTQKSAMRKLELELAHFRAAARRQRASDGVAAIAEAGRFAVF
jgi:hypothetical protein